MSYREQARNLEESNMTNPMQSTETRIVLVAMLKSGKYVGQSQQVIMQNAFKIAEANRAKQVAK